MLADSIRGVTVPVRAGGRVHVVLSVFSHTSPGSESCTSASSLFLNRRPSPKVSVDHPFRVGLRTGGLTVKGHEEVCSVRWRSVESFNR